MVFLKCAKKSPLCGCCGAPPQLSEYDCGSSHQTGDGLNAIKMAADAKLVNKY